MTISVYVDWLDNNDYADLIDDISADVISADWSGGMRAPYQMIANESVATITVKNTDGKYNPENTSSAIITAGGAIVPLRRVRIMVDGVIMWTGWLDKCVSDYKPAGAQTGKETATLHCTGVKRFLDAIEANLGIYAAVTGDEPIGDIVALLPPPAVPGLWLLGEPGYSELGESTYLGSLSDLATIETGTVTLTKLGDKTVSGTQAIKDITEAERGHFYMDRSGKYVWRNRQWLQLITAITADVTETGTYKPKKIDYRYGQDIFNQVRVTLQPRSSTGSITLWSLQGSVSIAAGATETFEAVFRDADGAFAGGESIGYSGETFSAGTAAISLQNMGNRAKVTLVNSGGVTATLTALNITGNAVQDRNKLVREAVDSTSIAAYGKRPLSIQINVLDTIAQADSIAAYELARRKDPRGLLISVVFLNKADGVANAHQIAWDMGTRLRVYLAGNGHSEDHHIIGESHRYQVGGVHETTFFLEPAEPLDYWLLGEAGYSELGETTYLGY